MNFSVRLLGGFLALCCGVVAAGAAVDKVDPPYWWAGHTINPVRLLIHGSGLSAGEVSTSGGLTASRITSSPSGRYLFVDITIPSGMPPGEYPLIVDTPEGTVRVPFRVEAPLEPSGRFQGFSSEDVIYLIMPDRFANGDRSNDDPPVSRGVFGRSGSRLYHGGDLQGIIDHLPYLKQLGVTAIWLTPIYDNTNETYASPLVQGQLVSDYHGYGTIDYYAVDEHLGDLTLLRKLVDSAHALQIKVIQDQVANHVSPRHPWVLDSPTPTWFHGTARSHLDETFELWHLVDPHAAPQLVDSVLNGWFGNFLPDLNQDDPELATYEIQNALWWVGAIGFDGIRQDTLPYVPRTFWARWSAALKRQYPKLRIVGEVMDRNAGIPSFFQGGVQRRGHDSEAPIDSGIDTVFDYPTYYSMRESLARGKSLEPLFKTVANDYLYPDASSLVTVVDDHDVARFLEEPGATLQRLKLAYAFLLTMRGTPVLYYGDEIGMRGGEDPDNRRDFPGGWPGDPRNAFEGTGRTAEENELFDFVCKLNHLRSELEPLRRGKMITVAQSPQAWIYARRLDGEMVLVALNSNTSPLQLKISLKGVEGSYRDMLGASSQLTFRNGEADVQLPPLTAAIYTQ